MKKRVESHKIKRISKEAILFSLNDLGMKVFEQMSNSDCERAASIIDSLKEKHLFTLESIDPAQAEAISDIEKQVFEALAFSLSENKIIQPTPQKIEETVYALYFSPKDFSCYSSIQPIWKISFDRAELIRAMP